MRNGSLDNERLDYFLVLFIEESIQELRNAKTIELIWASTFLSMFENEICMTLWQPMIAKGHGFSENLEL